MDQNIKALERGVWVFSTNPNPSSDFYKTMVLNQEREEFRKDIVKIFRVPMYYIGDQSKNLLFKAFPERHMRNTTWEL